MNERHFAFMRIAKSINVSILSGLSLKYLQQKIVVTDLQRKAYLLYGTEALQKLLTLCEL